VQNLIADSPDRTEPPQSGPLDSTLVEGLDVTIVMPCLNEADTLAVCIRKARLGLERSGVKGEVLVADNGSTDGSVVIGEKEGARVVHVKEKGYGMALRGGIKAAKGKWVIMGDADDSYDFSEIAGFVEKFRQGFDLVMGCRLPGGRGKIMPGAMPLSHRWVGNPMFTIMARHMFSSPIHDVYCGLRGFSKKFYEGLDLRCQGMEFATEMIIKASLNGAKITEVPITLHRDGRLARDRCGSSRSRGLRSRAAGSESWAHYVRCAHATVLQPGDSVGISIGGFCDIRQDVRH